MFRNLNWNLVGLQVLFTVICMKIADIILLNSAPEKILVPSCEIVLAVMILLLLRTKIRGSFGSLEIFIGGSFGLSLVNQKFDFLAIGVALVAIWLLEQNESKPETLTGKHYLWTTVVLLVFAGSAWYWFGVSSLKWIITVLIGWIFQMSYQLDKPNLWNINGDVWYPIQICSSKLWIASLTIANLGMLGFATTNSSINLALALVLGQLLQQDKIGRWFSITRLIAFMLVVLPELLQSTLQTLLQYY